MSSSDYNKIISTINSVSSSYSYSPDPNNLICIDSSNNRIGINTLNPGEAIDISGGNIRAKDLLFMEPINNSVSLKELLNIKAPINNPSFTGIISASNIDVSGNILPLLDASSSLGSSLKRWSNAYIRDISASNIDVSGSIVPLLDASSNLGSSLKRWSNAYIRDISVTNIDVSGSIVPLLDASSNLGSSLKRWSNAYIRDISVTNIDVSGNILPLLDASSNLGSSLKRWSNAYIRDISVTNIDVSGNLNPLIANRSSLGSSVKYWNNAYMRDVSIINIDVSGNILPLLDVSSNLGSSLKMWRIAYIRDISATNIDVSGNLNPLLPHPNGSSLGSTLKRWTNAWVTNINGSTYTGTSDDRVKHNEVIINNGLDVIDQLTPKFYQKTLTMLDANYNGDLSEHTWNYESGLIAQELLQISDLSFVVSGGDYYDSTNNLIKQTYGVNYNSVFVYGLAAIKELHAKVKAQETTILSLQTAILEQKTLINNIILAQSSNIS